MAALAFPKRLTGKKVAIFIDYQFEDLEVTFPMLRLQEEKRVDEMLNEAMKARVLEDCEAAIAAAQNMSPPYTSESLTKAQALLEALRWEPLRRCKIPCKAHEVPARPLVTTLLIAAAVNHLITSPLTGYYLFVLVKDSLAMPAPAAPLPSVARMAVLFVCAHTVNDFGFYWTHRMLHTKLLYATFHKQHHQFKGTVGAAAEFAGPVETIVSGAAQSGA